MILDWMLLVLVSGGLVLVLVDILVSFLLHNNTGWRSVQ